MRVCTTRLTFSFLSISLNGIIYDRRVFRRYFQLVVCVYASRARLRWCACAFNGWRVLFPPHGTPPEWTRFNCRAYVLSTRFQDRSIIINSHVIVFTLLLIVEYKNEFTFYLTFRNAANRVHICCLRRVQTRQFGIGEKRRSFIKSDCRVYYIVYSCCTQLETKHVPRVSIVDFCPSNSLFHVSRTHRERPSNGKPSGPIRCGLGSSVERLSH